MISTTTSIKELSYYNNSDKIVAQQQFSCDVNDSAISVGTYRVRKKLPKDRGYYN